MVTAETKYVSLDKKVLPGREYAFEKHCPSWQTRYNSSNQKAKIQKASYSEVQQMSDGKLWIAVTVVILEVLLLKSPELKLWHTA